MTTKKYSVVVNDVKTIHEVKAILEDIYSEAILEEGEEELHEAEAPEVIVAEDVEAHVVLD